MADPTCTECGESFLWNEDADTDDDAALCNNCAQAQASAMRPFVAEAEALQTDIRTEAERDSGQPDPVVAAVALALGSTPAEVLGGRRYAGAIRARHAAAVALRDCGLSYPVIARTLGKRDHATAMNAVKVGLRRVGNEPAFAAAVRAGVSTWRGEEVAGG